MFVRYLRCGQFVILTGENMKVKYIMGSMTLRNQALCTKKLPLHHAAQLGHYIVRPHVYLANHEDTSTLNTVQSDDGK